MSGAGFLLIANNKPVDPSGVSPASLDPFGFELNIVSWNMRSNKGARWSSFTRRSAPNAIGVALLQETWQTATCASPLRDERFFVLRCDTTGAHAKHGVAVAIRRSLVHAGTTPVVVCAGDARVIVVDFVDVLGKTRRMASLYFPADSVDERVDFMDALPWGVLETATIGCDSNLKTSWLDAPHASAARRRVPARAHASASPV